MEFFTSLLTSTLKFEQSNLLAFRTLVPVDSIPKVSWSLMIGLKEGFRLRSEKDWETMVTTLNYTALPTKRFVKLLEIHWTAEASSNYHHDSLGDFCVFSCFPSMTQTNSSGSRPLQSEASCEKVPPFRSSKGWQRKNLGKCGNNEVGRFFLRPEIHNPLQSNKNQRFLNLDVSF